MYDNVMSATASLKNLGLPIEHWDDLLIVIISEKFDFATLKEWQSKLTSELPTFSELIEFLKKRCEILESMSASSFNNNRENTRINSKVHVVATSNSKNCAFCTKKGHKINKCYEFLKLNIATRLEKINNLKLCINCLNNNHSSVDCKSRVCTLCNLKHHTLICANNQNESGPIPVSVNLNSNYSSNNVINKQVLLSTAQILIQDRDGIFHKATALIDMGSQANFITSKLSKLLKLKLKETAVCIRGVNDRINQTTRSCRVVIKSRLSSFKIQSHCLILDKITGKLPAQQFSLKQLSVPENIKLADPNCNEPKDIDLLLGADIFWQILEKGHIKLTKEGLAGHKTKFGWILGGNVKGNLQTTKNAFIACTDSNNELSKQIENFWTLENINHHKSTITDESELHFRNTFRRNKEGRYIVGLPFKRNSIPLGNSKKQAVKRFVNLEKRLHSNPQLLKNYADFLNEYALLGHMELIPSDEINRENVYYLPHHAVLKDDSLTTKLRVVFDASAKTDNNISLNDNLLIGANLQQDLCKILLRFRIHRYAVVADISKMYRQILVRKCDRDYQRILWRENPKLPLTEYRLKTVTYGTSCAPFLAIRTLHQLATDECQQDSLSYKLITEEFYMDDLLTGCNTSSECKMILKNLCAIMQRGGFQLCKWMSNCPDLYETNSSATSIFQFNNNESTKTLGMSWNRNSDIFQFPVTLELSSNTLTKRQVLSLISRIFDPLGLIGPITVKAKILIQKLWILKIGWDVIIPDHLFKQCSDWFNELKSLSKLQIPRFILTYPNKTIELHGFCDASKDAYGACVYLRCRDHEGKFKSQLLCAKSRVAPLKIISIPRLELCGAVLLSKLIVKIISSLKLNIDCIKLWTDSTIVLAWINSESSTLKTFVGNRVAEIQRNTNNFVWQHIISSENPADIISRGSNCNELLNRENWWCGPKWLQSDNLPRNVVSFREFSNQDLEKKVLDCFVTKTDPLFVLLIKFSDFNKLIRVTAYCNRFINNCKNKARNNGILSCKELQNATFTIIKLIQEINFHKEIQQLKSGKDLDRNSSIITLRPFLDDGNILRVGGRLANSDSLSYSRKFLIVLPKNNQITDAIIRHYHLKYLHAGPQLTLALIRQKYWIPSGRSQIRGVLHKCIRCFRCRPTSHTQLMGNLPNSRTTPTRPFLISGVDYAGPINVREFKGRGKRIIKAYICLFICFSTKAVHLELVCDYTSNAFLAALKRFIARRGHVKELYSDNATTFIGAKRQLSELRSLFKTENFKFVAEYLSTEGISWHFIPPRSPNFGGIWEAAIKSAKYHLKRVIGEAILTIEEMNTLLSQIEACLNSRPLTPLSNSTDDLTALTPGHFLIGEALTEPPEPDLTTTTKNRLSRWQLVSQVKQHFWKRWSREYLSQLHPRPQGSTKILSYNVGDLVLIHDENLPPLKWKLGRIISIHPGLDNVTRVVTLKTSSGELKRAVRKISVLPIKDEI